MICSEYYNPFYSVNKAKVIFEIMPVSGKVIQNKFISKSYTFIEDPNDFQKNLLLKTRKLDKLGGCIRCKMCLFLLRQYQFRVRK